MQSTQGIDYKNDWKMINIQIGSNDICGACNTSYADEVTPEKFGGYVEAAIDRIHTSVPKVVVNLIGTFNMSQLFPLTAAYPTHCVKSNLELCPCASYPGGLEKMTKLNIGKRFYIVICITHILNFEIAFNKKLVEIYRKYKKSKLRNFAVIYQPIEFNISEFPIDFFR